MHWLAKPANRNWFRGFESHSVRLHASVAQVAEQRPFKSSGAGSSPAGGTRNAKRPALESSGAGLNSTRKGTNACQTPCYKSLHLLSWTPCRAVLDFRFTRAWTAWTGFANRWIPQKDFAEFIEENILAVEAALAQIAALTELPVLRGTLG